MDMIGKTNGHEKMSMDYQRYRTDVSNLIYEAIPHGKEIKLESSMSSDIEYNLSHKIKQATVLIIIDTLTKGKARWCLDESPREDPQHPFIFRHRSNHIQDLRRIPLIVKSSDVGVPRKYIHTLAKRLSHSEPPLTELSLLRFDENRLRIADACGHMVSWYVSAPSAFTNACFLLNQCNKRLLAVNLCKVIEMAMNEALSKSRFADCKVTIPTHSREELEISKQKYVNGEIGDEPFKNLVFDFGQRARCDSA